MSNYRETGDSLRVLFCIGMRDEFFSMDSGDAPKIIEASRTALDNLGERFGLTVLGTMDDDELMVGPSYGFPWTAYILAEAPTWTPSRRCATPCARPPSVTPSCGGT